MATTYSAQAEEEKKKYNQIYDKQIEQINLISDANIKNLNSTYDDQQRAIEVQKLINERKVAESMANLGLTDSGLNRTQQTAVQLSAANARYQLDRQKQAAIDSYNLDRSNQIAQIEQNRLATDIEIDNNYKQLEARAKAVQQKENVINTPTGKTGLLMSKNGNLNPYYNGSLGENGISVDYTSKEGYTLYTDYNTGITKEVKSEFNPYTGTKNPDVGNGTFDNKYQPNNIKGEKLKLADKGAWKAFGQNQNVFYTGSGDNKKYWVWSRGNNAYIEVKLQGGQWVTVKDVVW